MAAGRAAPGNALGPEAGHGRFGLALILAASFMVVLDFSIVNVALPSIQRELLPAGPHPVRGRPEVPVKLAP